MGCASGRIFNGWGAGIAMQTIQVVPYDPKWPGIFAVESKLIKKALGANCVAIHHIGSTSVPGLSAKPKIDMIAVVKNIENSMEPLEKDGFLHKGEWNIPFKCGFTKRGEHKINLHVFEEHHPEIELNILFRDYLRSHPESLHSYDRLKEALLLNPLSSLKREGSPFSAYNLGKDKFIRTILEDAGYKKHRFLKVTHYREWEEYHRIKKTQLFDPIGVMYDPNHITTTAAGHHHFILCLGCEIVAIAHIEILNKTEGALRALATDPKFKVQGYGTEMMLNVERWLKKQKLEVLKMHSRLSAEGFYRKLGYVEMAFNDPCIQKNYIDLGKVL